MAARRSRPRRPPGAWPRRSPVSPNGRARASPRRPAPRRVAGRDGRAHARRRSVASASVPVEPEEANADRHGEACGERVPGHAGPVDVLGVLLEVRGVAVDGGRVALDARPAGEHDDVPSPAVAVEVERHARIGLDVADAGAAPAVHEHGRPTVPHEPDRTGQRRPQGRSGRHPRHLLLAQPTSDPGTELRAFVDHSRIIRASARRSVQPAQAVTSPPLGLSTAPTKYPASSEARNATVAAISSGSARRPAGVDLAIAARLSLISSWSVDVPTCPGATAFTRMPCTMSSLAAALVNPSTAAFAAE